MKINQPERSRYNMGMEWKTVYDIFHTTNKIIKGTREHAFVRSAAKSRRR